MADLYPAFVFLLLPLCHLLYYQWLGSLGAVGVQPASPPACGAASRPGQIEHERPGTVVYRGVGGLKKNFKDT